MNGVLRNDLVGTVIPAACRSGKREKPWLLSYKRGLHKPLSTSLRRDIRKVIKGT